MEHDNEDNSAPLPKRRMVLNLIGAGLLQPLAACGKGGKPMKKVYGFSVLLYSFMDGPITDILLNDIDIGGAMGMGTTGVLDSVAIPMGAQTLSWRVDGPPGTPHRGERFAMKSVVVVKESEIPKGAEYLGISLYPDYTVEYQFTEGMPRPSARGDKILDAKERNDRR